MKTQSQLVEELREKSAKANNGHGISCVKDLLIFWDRGQYDLAAEIRRTEGDKTRSYPEIEDLLLEIFGCRLHLTHDCQNKWCK